MMMGYFVIIVCNNELLLLMKCLGLFKALCLNTQEVWKFVNEICIFHFDTICYYVQYVLMLMGVMKN